VSNGDLVETINGVSAGIYGAKAKTLKFLRVNKYLDSITRDGWEIVSCRPVQYSRSSFKYILRKLK
jgi:hypothetical protein